MDFELTEEQKQIKALAKDFCEREVDPKRIKELSAKAAMANTADEIRANYPWDLQEKLYDLGLSQLAIPRKYGGTAPESDGNITRAIVAEELGYSGGGGVAALVTGQWFQERGIAINGYNTEEQKDWIFKQLVENRRMHIGGTISEPGGTTDTHLPYDGPGGVFQKTAYKDGNEWVINGDGMFSSDVAIADMVQVATRTDKDAPITQSMTWFWVPTDAPGVTIRLNKMLVMDLSGNAQATYNNVRVPESQLLAQVNKGFSHLQCIFVTKWILQAGRLGAFQRFFEQVRDYAKERIQGGKPIIEHSHIALMLGQIAVNLDAYRAYLYRTAWESDRREKDEIPANWYWNNGAFYFLKELSLRFFNVAYEVYGGIGGSVDLPLSNFVGQTILHLSGGTTTNMQAIKCCWEYDKSR